MEGPYLLGADEFYHTELKVVSADGTVEWPVVDETSHYGLGYTRPIVFHWSQDGRFMYYTNYPVPDGCALFVNGSDLYRVDLTDGSATQIMSPVFGWLALSSDEKTLVYVDLQHDLGLVLRDLETGAERRSVLTEDRNAQAGGIVWSSDGSEFIVSVAFDPCLGATWAHSLVRIDLASLTQMILIERDPRRFSGVAWAEPGKVQLADDQGQLWWLDTVTRQLTPMEGS